MTMLKDDDMITAAISRYRRRAGFSRVAPRAALIDMDGTLYDSMGNHADAWHRMMTELGVATTRDEFFLYEGMTGAATINLLFRRAFGRDATAGEVAELYHRKTVYFTELPAVNPMPGADEMLDFLASEGVRRVLVTGSGQSSLIGRLAEDFPGAFNPGDMITARDVTRGKPHPEPYLKAMSLVGVEPWQAIVLENAPLGVEAGAASGAFTIGVTTGPVPRQALVEAGADLVFPSMTECAAALPRLFNAF